MSLHYRQGVDPEFIRLIQRQLALWCQRTSNLTDRTVGQMATHRRAIFLAAQYGIELEETALAAAQLILQVYLLIEYQGYWREWIPLISAACRQITTQPIHLRLRLLLGWIHHLDRDYDQALEIHHQTAEEAKTFKLRLELANSYFYLSTTYYEKRNYAETKRYGEEALALFEGLSGAVHPNYAGTLNTLALLFRDQGKLAQAKEYFLNAIQEWQKAAHLTYMARAWYNLALVYQAEQNYPEALACYDQASAALEPLDNPFEKIKITIGRGSAYSLSRQYAQAEATYRQVELTYLRQINNRFWQAVWLTDLGDLFLKQEKFADAEQYLCDATPLWREQQDNLMLSNFIDVLTDLWIAQKKYQTALPLCEEGILLTEKHLDNHRAQELHQRFLAKIHKLLKEKPDLPISPN